MKFMIMEGWCSNFSLRRFDYLLAKGITLIFKDTLLTIINIFIFITLVNIWIFLLYQNIIRVLKLLLHLIWLFEIISNMRLQRIWTELSLLIIMSTTIINGSH